MCIEFERTRLPVPELTETPSPPLKAMTFPVPAAVPPTLLPLAPLETLTPPRRFGSAEAPSACVPM